MFKGAVVADPVRKNSPLAKAGIKQGDIIIAIDGAPVNDVSDLKKLTKGSRIKYVKGEKIQIANKAISAGAKRMSNGSAKSDAPIVGEMSNESVEGAGTTLYDFFKSQK